jgi:tetratricopeptide (TPR) repeat protein
LIRTKFENMPADLERSTIFRTDFMSKLLNFTIVTIAIGLVVTPVVRDQFRIEVARWYLAEGANRVAEGQDIQNQLEHAQAWAGDVTALRDFWLLRAEQALAESPAKLPAVIAEAVARDKYNFDIGYSMALRLAKRADFREAIAVLQAAIIDELRELPDSLNDLAYYRSLASLELDQALEDINLALEQAPDAPQLRDTRAWVLFQMGKPQAALADADFAVQEFDALQPSGLIGKTLIWLEQRLAGPPQPRSEDALLTRREAGELLWVRGVVHYHRAKILEALGRTEEAEQEFQWLRDRKLPADERLY